MLRTWVDVAVEAHEALERRIANGEDTKKEERMRAEWDVNHPAFLERNRA